MAPPSATSSAPGPLRLSSSRSTSSITSSNGGGHNTAPPPSSSSSGRLASLLRSAGRKSSESLRSVRSTNSAHSRRKSFGSNHHHNNGNQQTSSSVDSALTPPPPPVPKDSANRLAAPQRMDSATTTPTPTMSRSRAGSFASRPGAATTSRPPDIITNARIDSGIDPNDDGARTPTGDGRTTPTQAEPFGRAFQSSVSNTTHQPMPKSANGASFVTKEGDGNTVAQLYAVFGLPKDPSVWTLAEEDCVTGVHHSDGAVGRFWRPEVLGCSICPSPSELNGGGGGGTATPADTLSSPTTSQQPGTGTTNGTSAASIKGGSSSKEKSANNPKYIEMADGRGRIEKTETARILSKALKLSFTREIEIISGQANYPPMASSHTFSFSVPTLSSSIATLDSRAVGPSSTDLRKRTGAVGVSHHRASAATGEGYGLEATRPTPHGSGGADTSLGQGSTPATFYGVVLTVWSAADERRAKAIKRELNRAAKARTKDGKRINKSRSGAGEDDESASGPGFLPANNAFFMPYAICIVSRYPLYDLLGDWNKWAWHKYSRNIEMHNKLMSTILSKPAPRLGEHFVVDSPDGDLAFSCTFPGALEWGTGLIGVDFTMWPLFKTLTVDNILTICEIALAPNGRVLFHSRYPALLGLAVETIKSLVEFRGWTGIANQNCHARDVKIYLEDPGSWIIAIATELKSIVKPAKEVCVVDLDINFVHCASPPPGAPSTKGLREKRRKRLYSALGFSSVGDFRPPREYVEAYPGGRFRPLSNVIGRSNHMPYERLETPVWWSQAQVIAAFDKTLHESGRPSALSKLLRIKNSKSRAIPEAELAAIMALRKRASTFVDARDGLENKIGRLNKRLAFLMSESEMWKAQFSKIQQLVDRLTREANDTRAKLEKERRESRRLSTSLAQRDMERVQLQVQLEDTERARKEAQAELLTMQRAMDSLEHEREAMMDEIRQIISGAGGADDVPVDISRFDVYNDEGSRAGGDGGNSLLSSSHASSSHGSDFSSLTPSQAADRILKSRKAAEDRINAGRPSSRSSRSRHGGPEESSTGHRGGGSGAGGDDSTNLGGNHFPEDQINYEIQKRTSSVTDQISRIQAQLENTLSHLEDRRSHRRRPRRDSDASSASMRYEYRTPSSLGGGHGGGGGGAATDGESGSVTAEYPRRDARGGHSAAGHAESEVDYDSQSGYDSQSSGIGAGGARRSGRRRQAGDGSNGNGTQSRRHRLAGLAGAQGPPSAYRGPAGPSSNGHGSGGGGGGGGGALNGGGSSGTRRGGDSNGSAAMTRLSSKPSRDQLLQEREQINPWKVQAQQQQQQTPPQVQAAAAATKDTEAPASQPQPQQTDLTSRPSHASELSTSSSAGTQQTGATTTTAPGSTASTELTTPPKTASTDAGEWPSTTTNGDAHVADADAAEVDDSPQQDKGVGEGEKSRGPVGAPAGEHKEEESAVTDA